jgi:dephospho-CoA kinase
MGGIGAGKSTVTQRLGELGALVIEADRLGHAVLEPGGAAFGAVAARWPEVVYDGRIDRGALAAIVFRDADELHALEAMTHPAIAAEIERRAAGAGPRPVVVELPVDVGLGGQDWMRVAVVASEEERFARVAGRGLDPDDVRRRAAMQPGDEAWRRVADRVIVNDGTLEELTAAVDRLWSELHQR